MIERLDSRMRYKVAEDLIGFEVQREEGFAPVAHTIQPGRIVWADIDKVVLWEGQAVVMFFCEQTKMYVDHKTFVNSVRRTPSGNG